MSKKRSRVVEALSDDEEGSKTTPQGEAQKVKKEKKKVRFEENVEKKKPAKQDDDELHSEEEEAIIAEKGAIMRQRRHEDRIGEAEKSLGLDSVQEKEGEEALGGRQSKVKRLDDYQKDMGYSITGFNLREERESGKFDEAFNYKEESMNDPWLAQMDETLMNEQIRGVEISKTEVIWKGAKPSEAEEEDFPPRAERLRTIVELLEDDETPKDAIRRLGRADEDARKAKREKLRVERVRLQRERAKKRKAEGEEESGTEDKMKEDEAHPAEQPEQEGAAPTDAKAPETAESSGEGRKKAKSDFDRIVEAVDSLVLEGEYDMYSMSKRQIMFLLQDEEDKDVPEPPPPAPKPPAAPRREWEIKWSTGAVVGPFPDQTMSEWFEKGYLAQGQCREVQKDMFAEENDWTTPAAQLFKEDQ